MHIDFSIITLTVIILPYVSVAVQQPASYYSRFLNIIKLSFQV